MNDLDLHRLSSPHLLPAAMEFLKLLGVPNPAPGPASPSPDDSRASQRARSGPQVRTQKPEQQRVEQALDLLRQMSQELLKNPPTLFEAVKSNPTAQGQIFRRSLFVADELQLPQGVGQGARRRPSDQGQG